MRIGRPCRAARSARVARPALSASRISARNRRGWHAGAASGIATQARRRPQGQDVGASSFDSPFACMLRLLRIHALSANVGRMSRGSRKHGRGAAAHPRAVDTIARAVLCAAMSRPISIAHRGGRGLWPENTLFAFAHAMDAGCGGAELDVQLTRDGALVVVHDFRLSPAFFRCDGEWWRGPQTAHPRLSRSPSCAPSTSAAPMPRSQIRQAAFRITAPHDGEYVPLFADVLDLIGARDFHLFIEIKTAWHDRRLSAPPEAVADATLAAAAGEELSRARDAGQLRLDCAFTRARARTRASRAGFSRCRPGTWAGSAKPRGRRVSRRRNTGRCRTRSRRQAGRAGCRSSPMPRRVAVAEAHALGLNVGVWNLNTRKRDPQICTARGVDAICSDYPDRLVTALGRYKPSNSAVER